MDPIQVCMLGEFTLRHGSAVLRESGNRSRRIFSLLSFLICHRGQPISQYKLIDLLWGDSEELANPENALRILLHRSRAQLDQLYDGAGRDCILRKDGGYCWNPEVPLITDYERFEQLLQSRQEDRLTALREALGLYRGEFLIRQSSDSWVIPICTHFHNLFLQASQEAAQLLIQQQRHDEAAEICRNWISAEPYSEAACQLLMQILADSGNSQGITEVYQRLSQRLFDDFGIRPGEDTRQLYRRLAHSHTQRTMGMDEVLEHLQEPESPPGALQCDYDYFKMLCYAERRAMERSGTVTHVALLSITGTPDKPLSKRSTNRIMEQLVQVLRTNLRRGDVLSRCSTTQYIVMLPKANYEDSCMVCRRCIGAFQRAHPHVNIRFHFLVQPLSPNYAIP